MKTILTTDYVTIPEGVTVDVTRRRVRVKGPRGQLYREFKHANLEVKKISKKKIRVDAWFANRKEMAVVRSICSHIENMITGVTKGFQYKMRTVYAHFPINLIIADDKKSIDVRNFLGEKMARVVAMPAGVTVDSTGTKDEIALTGNSIEDVSRAAALVHQVAKVTNKDIRKFLDGVYVAEKTHP